jgi:hypothetical protein
MLDWLTNSGVDENQQALASIRHTAKKAQRGGDLSVTPQAFASAVARGRNAG